LHEVSATEELLRESLFGERRGAEVMIGHYGDEPADFALFFLSFRVAEPNGSSVRTALPPLDMKKPLLARGASKEPCRTVASTRRGP
jgi:hypothetical protein